MYEDLIEDCKEGYLFTIKLFKKSVGGEMSKIFFKTTSIYELDDELFLLEILFTTAYSRPIIGSETRWWHKGILKFSGLNYAKNVQNEYGIKVEVIDV